MQIKAKIEAIIYAAEEPVTLDQLAEALKDAGLLEELMRPKAEESTGGDSESRDSEAGDSESADSESGDSESAKTTFPPGNNTQVGHPSDNVSAGAFEPAAKKKDAKAQAKSERAEIRARLREVIDDLVEEYAKDGRG